MTSMENITAMLDLADKHAEKFSGTIHGKITPESVKRDIMRLQLQGFQISTPQKMARDELRRPKKQPKPKPKQDRPAKLTISEMRRRISDIDNHFRDGHGITEAAREAGYCDKTYRSYCEKTGTTPINKRQWVKMANGEVLTNEI